MANLFFSAGFANPMAHRFSALLFDGAAPGADDRLGFKGVILAKHQGGADSADSCVIVDSRYPLVLGAARGAAVTI